MDSLSRRWLTLGSCAALLGFAVAARADDIDALGLTAAVEQPQKAEQPVRAYAELAVGRIARRFGLAQEDARRLSIDFSATVRMGNGWRLAFSDRLDDIHPAETGTHSTLNSVREAYAGWQEEGGSAQLDFGRVNLRLGSAVAFNPTDYFREGANRAVTSVDPVALRENRLGTVMLRAQRLWTGGSFSVVLAPDLGPRPSDQPWSLDLGATNHSDRGLIAWNTQASERLSGQLVLYYERGKGVQLGASATALVSDAMVGYVEWSGGKDSDPLREALGAPRSIDVRNRLAAGATYTTKNRLALTAEFEYNGFAANQSMLRDTRARSGNDAFGAYLFEIQRRQDIASRGAAVLYALQRDAGIKNLDLTALLRVNLDDSSRFVWTEARYRGPSFDLALQWQVYSGGPPSEYGALTQRSILQVLAAFYF